MGCIMAKYNLDVETKFFRYFGYSVDSEKINHNSDNGKYVNVYDENNTEIGSILISSLDAGNYMKRILVGDSTSRFECTYWNFRRTGNFKFTYDGYSGYINMFEEPSDDNGLIDRLKMEKDGKSISFGFFYFSSKDDKDNVYRNITNSGFYLHYSTSGCDEYIVLSNMEQDEKHPNKVYAHYKNGLGLIAISSPTDSSLLHIERKKEKYNQVGVINQTVTGIATDDYDGMAFFDRMKGLINSIFPYDGDIMESLITEDEIQKYGLTPYFGVKKKIYQRKEKDKN